MKDTEANQATTKKAYRTPELSTFGQIAEMTRSNTLSQANDSNGGGGAGTKGTS